MKKWLYAYFAGFMLVGCTSKPVESRVDRSIAQAAPTFVLANIDDPSSAVVVANPTPQAFMNTVQIQNTGTQLIMVGNMQVVVGNQLINVTQGAQRFGVAPGQTTSFVIDAGKPMQVTEVRFHVGSKTESIAVLGTNRGGPPPGGFSSGN